MYSASLLQHDKVHQVAVLIAFSFLGFTCAYLPHEAYHVMSNTTAQMHCVAQNYAQMMTSRCVSGLQGNVERNAQLFQANVVGAMCGYSRG